MTNQVFLNSGEVNEEDFIKKVKVKMYWMTRTEFQEVYKTKKSISGSFKLKQQIGKF